ncbi:thiosulfate/3-mercaptopyruvate sulfurtransferase [Conyzicola lurida]|uniref:Thiosulfate/3-mercaptopyruvate sulfurtransferase n=1 Tax=Conyzicola lurida TaxID=1172621 RepID=A0A841AKH9_9MICO|nr:rhodanese-like domain-containing protein [Conyzicola lurida]MBB5842221.1 thiosulfate/3-mercaptopyruvate sulfurtransferase [Conyzicola lurida]
MTSPGPLLSSPVVSTQWLADHLGSENLVVLDATALPYLAPGGHAGYLSGHEEYLVTGHIPGAVFADALEDFADPNGPYPFTRPDAARFAAAASALGITNDTTVVAYDAVVGQWAARIWWLFRSFGYDNVAVLDGGLTSWKLDGRELEVGHVQPAVGGFTVTAERPELWADKAEVEAIVAQDGPLLCALPPKEFTGEDGHRSRLGHIPGSLSIPAGRIVDRDTKALLPLETLRTTFAPLLELDRVVTYCAGGIASSSDALALTLLGHTDVAIFDGSLNEWVADPEAPVVVTAA